MTQIMRPTTIESNGNLQSAYLEYLPAVYRDDDFMGRFLLIFESILGPLASMVDDLALYLDPAVCPDGLVPWLSSWVALVGDERLPLERRRRLIKAAAEIFRWRGTKRGLKLYLQMALGVEPLIVENTDGVTLGRECRLGINTRLGRRREHCIKITLPVADPAEVDLDLVRSIVESEKPAHIVYLLELVRRVTSLKAEAKPGGESLGS